LGVRIFFVISGFVISYTLAKSVVTPGFVANFILRRAVRLDPVYWVTLVVALGLFACSAVLVTDRAWEFLAWDVLLLNACYLQNLTGRDSLLLVAWPLCVEVQFYLVFVALLWLTEAIAPLARGRPGHRSGVYLGFQLPVVVASVGTAAGLPVPFKGALGVWGIGALLGCLLLPALLTRRRWAVPGALYVALVAAAY